jgi:hypothetical protein
MVEGEGTETSSETPVAEQEARQPLSEGTNNEIHTPLGDNNRGDSPAALARKRMPILKAIRKFSALFLAIAVLGAGVYLLFFLPSHSKPTIEATLSFLRSEKVMYIVTRKVSTQVVVTRDHSYWHSDFHGQMTAKLQFLFGFDLKTLTEEDISIDPANKTINVQMPEVIALSVSIDPGSITYITKATLWAKLQDMQSDKYRKEMKQSIKGEAEKQLRENGLYPDRREMLDDLQQWANKLYAQKHAYRLVLK